MTLRLTSTLTLLLLALASPLNASSEFVRFSIETRPTPKNTQKLFEDGLCRDCLANAIWHAEGGMKARVPYGVLTLKVLSASHARQVTLVSIANNVERWRALGSPSPDFLPTMARRWCPDDPINWERNVRWFYGRKKSIPFVLPHDH